MANNLIVCPVGMPIPKDKRWNDSDHWRWTKNNRDYETLVIVYNNFEPEPDSYDHIVRIPGHKWQLMQKVQEVIDINRFNYIGCVDDDLITGYQDFNIGLKYAQKFKFGYWQLSMPKDSSLIYEPLFNDPNCDFSETSFIEMGSCFFTIEKFKFLMEFIGHWDLKIAWGIDKTFFDLFQEPAYVVHSGMIHQPFRDSYYDKTEAMNEMNDYLFNKYPAILEKYYGRKSQFIDRQVTFRKFKIDDKTNNS